MKYFILLRANVKNQKGSFMGIAVLMFIITVSLLAILTIWTNGNSYEAEQLDRMGYGDIACWLTKEADIEKIETQLREADDTAKVERQEYIYVEQYHVGGQEAAGTLQIFAFNDEQYEYHVYNENFTGIKEEPEELLSGEIYVSPVFCSLYNSKIGDEVLLEISGKQEMVSCRIKGFFEDPVSGSSMMGIKSVLMSGEDMRKLSERIEEAGEEKTAVCGNLLHIFKSENRPLSMGEFQSLLNDRTDLNSSVLFSYSKSAIMGFMLILQNIFAGFLLTFMAVLLMITIAITGHSISSSIEQDYVNMGILKAVGFTKADLRRVQILQYLLAVLTGMLPGIVLSGWLIKLINRLMVTTTGIILPSKVALEPGSAALGIILLLIFCFIYMKTIRIGKITPVRAIRQGADDVYFKSRLITKIHKKGLAFHLAFRQLVSGKRQYVNVCMVTALLVFFLSLTGRIGAWMGEDGKGLMNSFSGEVYDFGFQCGDEELQKEIEKEIARLGKIAKQYEFKMERAAVNHIDYLMNVVSAPECFNVVEGRTCKYKNEIVVTEVVAKTLEVGIGDRVWVSYMGKDIEFIISGIYQCANDMGENFGISKEGWEQFQGGRVSFYQYYLMVDSAEAKEITRFLNEAYGDRILVDDHTWSGLDSVLKTMQALEIFMYAITAVFILVAVYLTGSKILYREQRDMGIYRFLGFTAGRLKTAFATRFALVAVAGSVLGNILSGLLTDVMAGAVLKMCGISKFESHLSPWQMIFSGMAVSGLFFIFSYLAAGKIKKAGDSVLYL